MRRIFNTTPASGGLDAALLVVRVSIGLMMLSHGIPKLQALFGPEPIQFVSFMGLGPAVSLGLVVFAEVICSVLILLGLGTRLATIPLIITMAVAVFQVHAADVFAKKEMALLYLVTYVVLALLGSGKYSVDSLVYKKQE